MTTPGDPKHYCLEMKIGGHLFWFGWDKASARDMAEHIGRLANTGMPRDWGLALIDRMMMVMQEGGE